MKILLFLYNFNFLRLKVVILALKICSVLFFLILFKDIKSSEYAVFLSVSIFKILPISSFSIIAIIENELIGKILNIETERKTAYSELFISLNKIKKNSTLQILRARMTTFNLKKLKLYKNNKIFIYISAVSIDRQAYQY